MNNKTIFKTLFANKAWSFFPKFNKNTKINRAKSDIPSKVSSWNIKKKDRARTMTQLYFSDSADKKSVEKSNSPITDYFEISNKVLGKGHYGIVRKGKSKYNNEIVAIKHIKIIGGKKQISAIKKEIEILSYVNQPNIMSLIDVFVTKKDVHLILPLCNGGDLLTRLSEYGAYTESRAKYHLRKLALAIKYLHDKGIVHRDLKPENILLKTSFPNSEMVIADFGLSTMVYDSDSHMDTLCGTVVYSAPEMNVAQSKKTLLKPYTSKVDTWCFGIIIYMILVCYHPFDPYGQSSDQEVWKCIRRGDFDFDSPEWQSISYAAKDLIYKLLVVNPDRRLSIDRVFRHPWFFRTFAYKKRMKKAKSWPGYTPIIR